ncbi:hypothetical protein YC2023_101462 [Brassica napus]
MFSRFGYQTSSFTKELLSRPTHFAVEVLSVSLMRYNASVIELRSEDTALMRSFILKCKIDRFVSIVYVFDHQLVSDYQSDLLKFEFCFESVSVGKLIVFFFF